MKNKDYFRKQIKVLREKLDPEEKQSKDLAIYNKVINNEYFKKAGCIFVYVSYKKEVDTHRIIKHALQQGKRVCVPKILSKSEGMLSVEISSFEELKMSSYGILEPEDCGKQMPHSHIGLVLLPGVAFDLKGGRIGYGGGFYDRYMEALDKRIPKLGLAYSFQIFDQVPMGEKDVPIQGVITD